MQISLQDVSTRHDTVDSDTSTAVEINMSKIQPCPIICFPAVEVSMEITKVADVKFLDIVSYISLIKITSKRLILHRRDLYHSCPF